MTPITKAIPPISAESIQIRTTLKLVKEGDIITLDQITRSVGAEVKQGSIRSAVVALEKEQIVFYKVRRIGWKRMRLDGSDIIAGESSVPKSIARKVRRSLRRLSAVSFEKLDNECKLKHSSVAAQLGTIALFSAPKAQDRIYAATIGNGAKPNTEKLLELFKKE